MNSIRKISGFLTLVVALIVLNNEVNAQTTVDRKVLVQALKSIDSNIVRYFPRWKVCEPDLRVQVYQNFLLFGYPMDSLDMQNITVIAAPKTEPNSAFTLLTIECGSQRMVASEIDANMEKLARIISGEVVYSGIGKGDESTDGKRTYCFEEIPAEIPLSSAQEVAIVSFLEPTNVVHSFAISLFEQSVKIGDTGFWFRSGLGNDKIGYPFWSAGEGKVVLRRPLYLNTQSATKKAIPHLIDASLGASYRLGATGIDGQSSILDFVPSRHLNAGPGGKLIAGLDFHMPFDPKIGLAIDLELPLKEFKSQGIDDKAYARYTNNVANLAWTNGQGSGTISAIAPILRSSGQVSAFYHWWLDPNHPENYFRFDLGLSYHEVREAAYYKAKNGASYLTTDSVSGLKLYKPSEFGDWIYLKAEYRNQSTWPFGISLQYSNQVILGRVYVPLIGQWLYLEGKYSTPLRSLQPYETRNFFMVSPVLRLNI